MLDTNGKWVDIPVKIINLETGSTVTPNAEDGVQTSTVFTRRFVMFDTVSSISTSGGYVNGTSPTVRTSVIIK